MFKNNTKALSYSAVAVALAIVLNNLTVIKLPQGGSVTVCSMLMIVLVGYWFGIKYGILAGVSMGIINFILGGYVVHPLQLLLDYPVAFGMLGLSGLFKNRKNLVLGYIVAVVGRYLCHVASGMIFFSQYAPPNESLLVYSASYNATYIVPEMIATVVILLIPAVKKVIDQIGEQANQNSPESVIE